MDKPIIKTKVNEETGELGISMHVETEEEITSSEAQTNSKVRFVKPTQFDMLNAFFSNVQHANIDGVLHIFSPEDGYYKPVDQRDLEDYLLNNFYDMVVQSGSMRIVKACAELILRRKSTAVISAEKQQILCFANGFLPITNTEQTSFMPYNPSTNVYPTYCIKADGFLNMSLWSTAKAWPTPWMDWFINGISAGNQDVATRIWQMIGYLLTPDVNGKCFFVLQGVPNSGKSVLSNFIAALLPDHRIASLDIDQLGKKHATSELVSRSINISNDLPNKPLSSLAIRNIKLMTGNDDITVEYPNGRLMKYHGNCKFLFSTNHALTLKGTDDGFLERLVCIPFTSSVPASQRNRMLMQYLLNEKDLIVAKAIAYYRDLRLNNYVFAGTGTDVCDAKIRYLPTEADDTDANLCQFVDEKCQFTENARTYTSELYNAYTSFCRLHGYTPIDNIASFSRRLNRCYADKVTKNRWRDTDGDNQNGFCGITIRPDPFNIYNEMNNVPKTYHVNGQKVYYV